MIALSVSSAKSTAKTTVTRSDFETMCISPPPSGVGLRMVMVVMPGEGEPPDSRTRKALIRGAPTRRVLMSASSLAQASVGARGVVCEIEKAEAEAKK